jgi:hypothetical protein
VLLVGQLGLALVSVRLQAWVYVVWVFDEWFGLTEQLVVVFEQLVGLVGRLAFAWRYLIALRLGLNWRVPYLVLFLFLFVLYVYLRMRS